MMSAIAALLVILAMGFSTGPAPNAGDGIPDGSGITVPVGPSTGRGPAPNAGDGIPDGPGF